MFFNDYYVYCEHYFKLMHYKCVSILKNNFNKICENDLPFFCETFSLKISDCYKCNSVCKNSKNCSRCFLCNNKCFLKFASEKVVKLSQFQQGSCKFYCDICKESVFSFQNVYDLYYECLNKSNEMNFNEKIVNFLDVNCIKFGRVNTISAVYMNIRSLKANLCKIEEILSLVENLPDIICVCETWLTSLRPFVGKLQRYDFVNWISKSNQSGGVVFFVKDFHNYEIIKDVVFGESDVDNLWLKVKLSNNKSMVVSNLYRHPSSLFTVFQENFVHVLDYFNNKNRDFIIGGYVNINLLKTDQHIVEYLECISYAGARQVVNTSTRFFL